MDELTRAINDKIKSDYKSVREFSSIVNVPYTTIKTALEKGFGGTAVETVIKICSLLNININDFTGCESTTQTKQDYTDNEKEHLKKYQLIGEHGREVIDTILDLEYKHYEQAKTAKEKKLAEEKTKKQTAIAKKEETQKAAYQAAAMRKLPDNVVMLDGYDEEPEDMITLPLYDTGASAGTGVFLDSNTYDMIAIQDDYATRRANFAVWVTGDSMEPRFSNGDLVLVRTQPAVDIGEIGIFVLNGEGYIKKLGKDKLVSLNPAYADIEFDEDDDVCCKGKVLRKA